MKNITFRGKARYHQKTYGRKRGDWVQGSYGCRTGNDPCSRLTYEVILSCIYGDWGMWQWGEVEIIPGSLCLSYGHKDKNGKLIFSNDIVKVTINGVDSYISPVNSSNKGLEIYDYVTKEYNHIDYFKDCVFEVVGNKFDNLEMLADILK